MIMKKILIIFGLAFAAVSCARIVTNETKEQRIGFDTYALRTKAGSSFVGGSTTTTSNIAEGASFGVFAYFHPKNTTTGAAGKWDNTNVANNLSNMLLNEQVTRVQPSAGTYAYTYSNTRYWPRSEYDRISFFAYYPYAANAFVENSQDDDTGITLRAPGDAFVPYSSNPYGFPRFRFVVNRDSKKQVDFMISDMCLNQSKQAGVLTGSPNDVVKFTFHHMLSQIRVKAVNVEKDNAAVEVSGIEFTFLGVPESGIVTPRVDPDYLDADGLPVNADGLAPLLFSWTNTNSSNTQFTTDIYEDDGTEEEKREAIMLMIPHTFSTDPGRDLAEVSFTVTRTDYGDRGEHYTYQGRQTVSLAAGGLTGWEPNKIYNYTIRISLRAVEFSVEVQNWPEASTDAIIVDLNNEEEENT